MEIELNKEAWHKKRLGKITASNIWKLMKAGRKKEDYFTGTALSYLYEKIAEMLTGEVSTEVNTLAMKWGNEKEEEAIGALREKEGLHIEYFGGNKFSFFPFNAFSGASPDGLSAGYLIEVKCPFVSKNHIEVLLACKKENPSLWLRKNRYEYYLQMQFGMMCTQKDKALFVSFDPRMIEIPQRLARIEIKKDEFLEKEIKERIVRASSLILEELKLLELQDL